MSDVVDLSKRRLDEIAEQNNNRAWTPEEMLEYLLKEYREGNIDFPHLAVVGVYLPEGEEDPYGITWESYRSNMSGAMFKFVISDMLDFF